MRISQIPGNRPDKTTLRVRNNDTVKLTYGQPVVLSPATTADLKIDGLYVVRPSVATAGKLVLQYGVVIDPGGIDINYLGNVLTFGMVTLPVAANSRANVGTAYSTHAAITAPTGLTIDFTNDCLTGLTVVAPTTSNFTRYNLVDTIAADQGNGTTPAAGLVFLVNVRVFVTMGY